MWWQNNENTYTMEKKSIHWMSSFFRLSFFFNLVFIVTCQNWQHCCVLSKMFGWNVVIWMLTIASDFGNCYFLMVVWKPLTSNTFEVDVEHTKERTIYICIQGEWNELLHTQNATTTQFSDEIYWTEAKIARIYETYSYDLVVRT